MHTRSVIPLRLDVMILVHVDLVASTSSAAARKINKKYKKASDLGCNAS